MARSDAYRMSTIEDLERAVRDLQSDELARFRAWFAEFDAQEWDRQFERDANSGKLDQLAADALRDLDEGRCTDL